MSEERFIAHLEALESGDADVENALKTLTEVIDAERKQDQHEQAEKKSAEIRLELETAQQLEAETLARTKHLRSYF